LNYFSTANKELIKKMNTNAILNVIRDKGPISRADIAKALSLNPATISSNVNDLIGARLIKEIGSGESNGGRKPILLTLNSAPNYIIGVHTELSHVNIGIINLDGKIIVKNKYKYNNNQVVAGDIISTIVKGIKDIMEISNVDTQKIIGIGLGIHGLVDSEKGVSIFAPAFKWHNVPIIDILQRNFNTNIILDNDVRVMALGEKWFGKAVSSNNFVLINLGEGIGGAIVINGKLHSGNTFGAGEIGHIKVTQKPYYCNCGNKGCLTTVASEEGLIERLKEKIIKGSSTMCDINNITIETIKEAAINGDKTVIKLLKQTGDYIGRSIGMIINILNPERIILTGTILIAKDFFIDKIIESAEAVSIRDNFAKTKITTSSIKEDLGIIGSATLILNDLFTV